MYVGDLIWANFRGRVLGSTDPTAALADSLRGKILAKWQGLGLQTAPDTGLLLILLVSLSF